MQHTRQLILLCTSFFLISVTVCSCHSKQSTTINSVGIAEQDFITVNKTDSSITLNKTDSSFIFNNERESTKVDSLISESGCSITWKFFDTSNRLLIFRNQQLCLADSRMKWSSEIYYDKSGKEILKLYRDMLGGIVELKRSY
jgi:hypothetical protein